MAKQSCGDQDQFHEAFMAQDRAYEGCVFACITTTGIFCRLSCPVPRTAEKSAKENILFMATATACLEQGYRPCKTCRPLAPAGEPVPAISDLLSRLEQNPLYNWSEKAVRQLGYDPATVRQLFRQHIGMTFLDLARLLRASHGAEASARGTAVTDSPPDAGHDPADSSREAVNRMLGHSAAGPAKGPLLHAAWIDTPIGAMLAVADAHALHLLEFHNRKTLKDSLRHLQKATGSAISFGLASPIEMIRKELGSYFAGVSAAFHTPLVLHGTPFRRRTWEALRRIPPGRTHSYKQQAASIGNPVATRAVANANSSNRIAIVIPCHRVIGADGALTGYSGGLWRKNWLIDHERRHFRACLFSAASL